MMHMTNALPVPELSIVIPAFNAADVLPLQLDALEAQEDAPTFEVVVVDNASTDDTAETVNRRARVSSYRLTCVAAPEVQGAGYARNVGVRHASADRLVFLDADDVASRWLTAHALKAFEDSSLWSGSGILLRDDQFVGSLEEIRAECGDSSERIPLVPGDLSNAFPVLMGGVFGATRDVYERLGGFDLSRGTVYEDNDFGVRAHRAGIPVDNAPSVRIAYRGKWDMAYRAALARRSARAHVLTAKRYGLESQSPMPSGVSELVRSLGAGALMVAGRKPRDFGGVRLRAATAWGLIQGGIETRVWRPEPPRLGVGLAASTTPNDMGSTTGKGSAMRIPGGATFRRLQGHIAASSFTPLHRRAAWLEKRGMKGASSATFAPNVRIQEPRDVQVGRGCFINEQVYLDRGGITLGENVYIGPRAVVITAKHPVGGPELRAAPGAPVPVSIGDGTWIGANATILPGVTIGPGCVIAAGAVVTRDCAPNGLYGGVPARRIKDLPTGKDA